MPKAEITVKPGARSASIPNHQEPTATSTSKVSIPVDGVYMIDASAGLTGDIEIRPERKVRVVDVWAVQTGTGAASDTFTVKNNSSAISNALDMNVVDTTVVRAGTLDDANWDVDPDASTPEDIVLTGASAATGIVFIRVVPVA